MLEKSNQNNKKYLEEQKPWEDIQGGDWFYHERIAQENLVDDLLNYGSYDTWEQNLLKELGY